MKKLLVLFVCLFTLSAVTYAKDDRPVNVNQLPVKSQQFIKKFFPNVKIALAKEDKGWFDQEYEVIFVNGNKVEFRKNGDMKKVDCKYGVVPAGIVPVQIAKYVKENHPDMPVIKFEQDAKEYEVKLKGGIELTFDLQFRLTDYDD
ncbi:PepSY-like domain-containing protein [Coprobacter sp.]